MAWAQELKSLVADIKTSHKDRTARIHEIKDETRDILKDANNYMRTVSAELKEMAKDVKDFLAKSEETRTADFKATMKDVRETVGGIEKSTRALLGDYRAERKEAAGYWAGLRGRGTVETEEVSEAPKKKKKKRLMFL